MTNQKIMIDPEIMGGTPVFAGTRVPVRILFEHLEACDSLDVFLEDFTTVSRELAVAVLEEARSAVAPMRILLDESVPRGSATGAPDVGDLPASGTPRLD